MKTYALLVAVLLVAACDPKPVEKVATYDVPTQTLTLPAPCPDWSSNSVVNYRNQNHSNYGCAVNRNLAIQVDDPHDLVRGRGNGAGDAEASATSLELYRAGKLPEPLEPQQDDGGGE
jgi:type IV pilus biogenesis protein CpaD/CtpE